jgi:hypothetical protein
MRPRSLYGRDREGDALPPPRVELFRYRAAQLIGQLGLCDRCLRSRPRCFESRRCSGAERSWKAHRKTRYRAR